MAFNQPDVICPQLEEIPASLVPVVSLVEFNHIPSIQSPQCFIQPVMSGRTLSVRIAAFAASADASSSTTCPESCLDQGRWAVKAKYTHPSSNMAGRVQLDTQSPHRSICLLYEDAPQTGSQDGAAACDAWSKHGGWIGVHSISSTASRDIHDEHFTECARYRDGDYL